MPWSINALAQIAGITALQNKKHLVKSKLIKKEYEFLLENFLALMELNFMIRQLILFS